MIVSWLLMNLCTIKVGNSNWALLRWQGPGDRYLQMMDLYTRVIKQLYLDD